MPCGDDAFDADLAASVLRDLGSAARTRSTPQSRDGDPQRRVRLSEGWPASAGGVVGARLRLLLVTKQQAVLAEPEAHGAVSHAERRWYERRAVTVGAGVAVLAALALIGLTVVHISRRSNQPSHRPLRPTTRSTPTTLKTSAMPSASPAPAPTSLVPPPASAPTSTPEFEPSAPPPSTAESTEATPTTSTGTTCARRSLPR